MEMLRCANGNQKKTSKATLTRDIVDFKVKSMAR